MAVSPGTRIGPYDIVAPLGAGGMGEVYRARDTKLGREVALKILPEAFASDPDRLMRFEREARTLASLNHPHIAQVYGIEDSGATRALVMELVAGEDLSARIARGPIPLDEALPIARQIAEALEAAHEAGIIHRDLKPANIKLRDDGTVKVLDFGLAKALDVAPDALGDGATITSPAMTMRGVILGTAAYMAPEQAKGKPVDRRADIWAFGCVLYEMLTGRRTFKGDDLTDTLTAVLRDEPDWTALPAETPPPVRALLRRCLQKDPRQRLPHVGIVRLDLAESVAGGAALESGSAPPSSPPMTRPRWRERLAWGLVLVAAAAALAMGMRPGERAVADPPLRFTVETPEGVRLVTRSTVYLAVSPNGQQLAFVGQDERGEGALWVHAFGTGRARLLDGTQGALHPFWSPDARHLAFAAAGSLKRIDLQSGAVQTVCELRRAVDGFGMGTWSRDDVILFSDGALYQVRASGGVPEPATSVDDGAGDFRHNRPHFLPDGRHFVFSAINRDLERSTLRLGELGRLDSRTIGDTASSAEYVQPGLLVYAAGGRVLARPFDAAIGQWTGDPSVLAESVRNLESQGAAAFSTSRNGALVYDEGTVSYTHLTLPTNREV